MAERARIGMLIYPNLTHLDLIGPAQVFAMAEEFDIYFVWKDLNPVQTDAGLEIIPNCTLDKCPAVDVLFVPGGPGQMALMQDTEVLEWLSVQGHSADWVTSVCSGSLLLGAAGLLNGYQAASHWNYRELLPMFGATINTARVVRDRNRITGGGVTAGIDLALTILGEMRGEQIAKEVQLLLEYAPEPPFECGRPETSTAEVINGAKKRLEQQLEKANSTWFRLFLPLQSKTQSRRPDEI